MGTFRSIFDQLLSKAGLLGLQRKLDNEPMRLGRPEAPMRLLIVVNAIIPTLHLSLLAPLKKLTEEGELFIDVLTEREIVGRYRWQRIPSWIEKRFRSVAPTCILFCRYSGPCSDWMVNFALAHGLPTIYCIDDDLLNVPLELGRQKFEYHNQPSRLGAVRYLLDNVGVVYCSNSRLLQRLRDGGVKGNLYAGKIFCAGRVIAEAELRAVRTIGYMGFDHAHDFEIALPAVINILRRYPELRFELFGRIPKPWQLDEFGDRVVTLPVVSDYDEFLLALADRQWDIGICPLAPTEFNQVKNVNKWIEYTSVGAAVVASHGMIYDECCDGACGLLATKGDWESSLVFLIENTTMRFEQVRNAQHRLVAEYSMDRLRGEIREVLLLATKASRRIPLVSDQGGAGSKQAHPVEEV